ncbi:MAG: fimbrial protein [Rahnella inusitata]|uniref:fimbrial protein n=1 Tax=Rahnella inusitata TaxID=58169 RepID=UPI0018144E1E|nr:fimbrial protein [Rahnella inusitata]NMC24564.1 type 1 fimbrial protein [Serratia sp. (in: enterobacteria)]QUT15832.1 type 1 fimbrial protein [Rahnella inusitata]
MKTTYKLIVSGLLLALAGNSYAIDGTIKFTGEILKTTCVINNGSDVKVELGHYAAAQFTKAGETSPQLVPVILPLTNCPVTDTIPQLRVWLEAEPVDASHPNLIQVGEGVVSEDIATGVGIEIIDSATGSIMPLNKLSDISYPITGSSMNINWKAYYRSYVAPDDIHEGAADASVNVTLDYR